MHHFIMYWFSRDYFRAHVTLILLFYLPIYWRFWVLVEKVHFTCVSTSLCIAMHSWSDWCCSYIKNSTLSIQACLNIETLFWQGGSNQKDAVFIASVSKWADKLELYLEAQFVMWNMWFQQICLCPIPIVTTEGGALGEFAFCDKTISSVHAEMC